MPSNVMNKSCRVGTPSPIKPVVEGFEYQCFTAKDIYASKKSIPDKTREMIDMSSIFIADITHSNPNVMYEIGIAHAKDKNIILLTQEEKSIVNLRSREMILYENAIAVKNEEYLERRLRKAIEDIINNQ
jgi:nucleoside 2-deoxyribosyltransferase